MFSIYVKMIDVPAQRQNLTGSLKVTYVGVSGKATEIIILQNNVGLIS